MTRAHRRVLCQRFLTAALLPATAAAQSASTSRVTVSPTGDQVPQGGWWSSISADGSKVAFGSISALYVPGDSNGVADVFVHDRAGGKVVRASLSSAGVEPNGECEYPHLSADGLVVAFESTADNLVPGDGNQSRDVFVRDTSTGLTERASVDSNGQASVGHSFNPALSADGSRVAFDSQAAFLVAGDTNGVLDVFVRDRQAATTVRASVSSAGQEGDGSSEQARISEDGRFVAFQSLASNLVPGDANGTWDVFVHELSTGQTARVSVASGGVEGDDMSLVGSLSADGRYVGFYSRATNLVPGDLNGQPDCFVHDRLTGATTRVSLTSAGAEASGESWLPALSADGRYVAFQSLAKDLVGVYSGADWAVYVHDRSTGATTLESLNSSGYSGSRDSRYARLSADGRHVTFTSWGRYLVPDDSNNVHDVFVRDRIGCSATVASYCVASSTSIAGCTAAMASLGTPSVGAASGFELSSGPLPGGGLGVLRFGVAGSSALPIGTLGGQVCVSAPQVALTPKPTGGAPGSCNGSLRYTLAEMLAIHPTGVRPGSTVHASFILRDAANPDGFATSNGIWFQLCP